MADDPQPADEQPASAGMPRYDEFVLEYTRSYHRLYSFVLVLVPDQSQADDVMQEAGLLLWRKFDDFAPGTDFVRWARAFIRNLVRNERRLRKPDYLAFDDELLAKLAVTQAAADECLEMRREALQSCMEKLPRQDRRVLHICYTKHTTIAAAAEELRRTPNAVYQLLRRLRFKLLRCVERTLGLTDDYETRPQL